MTRKKFTAAYLRFNRQLTALQKGQIDVVKKLARQAREELLVKNSLYQLKLRGLTYDSRTRN